MAKTTDSLVIDVSVNSNDVIKFFEVLSDKLNQLLGYAQSAGEKLLMFPCVNWPRVFICLNKSSTF